MYEVGKVYVWQNISHPDYSYLNGQETVVTGNPIEHINAIDGTLGIGSPTDTIDSMGRRVYARKGRLRPKNPPSGEQSIYDQFKRPINTKTPEMA